MLPFGIKKKEEAADLSRATVMDKAAQNNIQLKQHTQRSWLVITVTPG